MRIIPISEIPKLMPDETIPAIKGKIKKVGKKYSGDGDYGPWSLQTLEIAAISPDTGVARVCIKDREEIPANVQGKTIYIYCHQGDKGLTGLKAKDKVNKNTKKEEREVSVTKTANIEYPGSDSTVATASDDAGDPPNMPIPEDEAPTPQSKQPQTTKAQTVSGESGVKVALAKKAHLFYQCLLAANYSCKQAFIASGGELTPSPDKIFGVAETLYIDAHRDGLHTQLDYKFAAKSPAKPQQTSTNEND